MNDNDYRRLRIPDLPDDQWATTPLLDESNIGRMVMVVNNGNYQYAHPAPIVKIGRTNIHVDSRSARPYSLRVDPDGHGVATGDDRGFSVAAWTRQQLLDDHERRVLATRVRQWLDHSRRKPMWLLRDIVALIDQHEDRP